MHGIIPRTLWQRAHTPDDKHRIPLVARALVVDEPRSGARTLIETGMGRRWTKKEREIYALADTPDVPDVLRAAGVDPDTITHVVLTHLHWDHAGGAVVKRDDGSLALAFPRARHVVGKACAAYAAAASDKDAGSFRPDDVELVLSAPSTLLWEGGELAPGLDATLSNGHTPGLVVPWARERDGKPPLAFPTDLVPTKSHLRPSWVMAYDTEPVVSVREKQALFDELAKLSGELVLYHDPLVEAARAVATKHGPELEPCALS
jgi:glyoxylase-like metal-dependent hydrolase (beta-lactamase superfamily II)